MMLGTPAYMAPEQLAGGVVTPHADVYAFGIVFSEMLTGQHPLAAGRSASADTSLRRDLPHNRELNPVGRVPPEPDATEGGPAGTIAPRLAAIIQRCVNPDPNQRYANGGELLAALADDVGRATGVEQTAPGSPRWWWEFHQAVAAGVYWVMAWPAWKGREVIGGPMGRALFIATLIAVIVAANLRLHLWFTSRFYPAQLRWARRRTGPWIRAADWLFVASLAVSGILVGEDRSPVAVVLIAVAVGAAIAFLVIERATARAAFHSSATPREGMRHP
jgi:hypothetical protein